MRLRPGRIVGVVMGLVILAAILLLPFGSSSSTLYGIVSPMIKNLSTVQSSGDTATLAYNYTRIIAFVLLVIAGLVGFFPLGAGVLGMVGMAMITISPFLIYPNGPYTLSTGAGFYVAWVASVVALVASRWQGEKETPPPVSITIVQAPNMGTQAAQPTKNAKCPICGADNPEGATKCSSCGKDLPVAT
ncbi:MAG: zinc ribbon domain-containing protein [Nitrososphaerales archaeon]